MVYEPQSTPRLLVNNMSFRLESICVGYRATCIRFNGLHRTVFMLCRVQGIAQRARRAWIQAAAFFCWLASAAASSGPPSVSNRDSQTRDERLSSCVVQLVLCESRACSASAFQSVMRLCPLRDRTCAPVKGVPWKSQTRPRLRSIPIATCGGPPPGPLAIHGFVCPHHSGNLRCTSGFLGPVPNCLCAPQDENSSSAASIFEQIRSERTKSRLRTGSPCLSQVSAER